MRHEDIDNHQVEGCAVKRPKPGFAAIGDRHLEAVPFKKDLDSHTNHWVVVDHKNTRHVSPLRLNGGFRRSGL